MPCSLLASSLSALSQPNGHRGRARASCRICRCSTGARHIESLLGIQGQRCTSKSELLELLWLSLMRSELLMQIRASSIQQKHHQHLSGNCWPQQWQLQSAAMRCPPWQLAMRGCPLSTQVGWCPLPHRLGLSSKPLSVLPLPACPPVLASLQIQHAVKGPMSATHSAW